MITVAIVDDEKKQSEHLKNNLKRFFRERGEEYSVALFPNGKKLLEGYTSAYDVIFMDIEMPYVDGMEVAKKIREIDEKTVIIFVTAFAQYAVNGYDVRALDFIVKPVEYFSLSVKMNKALAYLEKSRNRSVYLKNSDEMHALFLSEIYYVESFDHSVLFHTARGNFTEWSSLKAAEKKINSPLFVYCHRSFLVNLSFVSKIRADGIICAGDDLPFGVKKRKEFLTKLAAYLGEK